MNWREDFEEGFRTGEDNEKSLGMVMLFLFSLCVIMAGAIIVIGKAVM
jgi:hypothetical protein